jgi:hypothetical protein
MLLGEFLKKEVKDSLYLKTKDYKPTKDFDLGSIITGVVNMVYPDKDSKDAAISEADYHKAMHTLLDAKAEAQKAGNDAAVTKLDKEIENLKTVYKKQGGSTDADIYTLEVAQAVGESIGINFGQIDLCEFTMGMNVELEHTDITQEDPKETARIALAHLKEIPDYYSRLKVMEAEAGVTDSKDLLTNDPPKVKDAFMQEGDKVKILYGTHKDKTGTFVDYSPSGDFAIVKVGGQSMAYHISDIKAINKDASPEDQKRLESLKRQLADAKKLGDSNEVREIQEEIDKIEKGSKDTDVEFVENYKDFKIEKWDGKYGIRRMGASSAFGKQFASVEEAKAEIDKQSKTGDSITCDALPKNITFGGKGYRCVKCGATSDKVHMVHAKVGDASPKETYNNLKGLGVTALQGVARRINYPELNDLKHMDKERIMEEIIVHMHGSSGEKFLENPNNFDSKDATHQCCGETTEKVSEKERYCQKCGATWKLGESGWSKTSKDTEDDPNIPALWSVKPTTGNKYGVFNKHRPDTPIKEYGNQNAAQIHLEKLYKEQGKNALFTLRGDGKDGEYSVQQLQGSEEYGIFAPGLTEPMSIHSDQKEAIGLANFLNETATVEDAKTEYKILSVGSDPGNAKHWIVEADTKRKVAGPFGDINDVEAEWKKNWSK